MPTSRRPFNVDGPKTAAGEQGLLRQILNMGALSAGALIESDERNTISLRSED